MTDFQPQDYIRLGSKTGRNQKHILRKKVEVRKLSRDYQEIFVPDFQSLED